MATKRISIQPLGGNILVKPQEQETTTASGLVIAASTAKGEKPQRGVVMALGTGKLDKDGNTVAWNVKVGDDILFRKYSPDEIETDDENLLIMKEEDVLAVINK